MTTVIEPSNGKSWEEIFPEVVTDTKALEMLNQTLYWYAAFMTRGDMSAQQACEQIIKSVIDLVPESGDTQHLADHMRMVYYANKILDVAPVAWREKGFVTDRK